LIKSNLKPLLSPTTKKEKKKDENKMAYPLNLSGLTPREEITDAVHRLLLAIDHNSPELLNSAIISRAKSPGKKTAFELWEGGKFKFPIPSGLAGVVASMGEMDTLHMISNVRIDVREDGETAGVVAYALAQHVSCSFLQSHILCFPPNCLGDKVSWGKRTILISLQCKGGKGRDLDGDKFETGSEYRLELVKEDGEWKIWKWVVDIIWKRGDDLFMKHWNWGTIRRFKQIRDGGSRGDIVGGV
jgi:hypothetical protein